MSFINPERDRFKELYGLPLDEPVEMLNLLRFRDVAAYSSDDPEHGESLSGRQAYARYSREASPIFTALGGTQIWIGVPALTLVGPGDERWELAFVARYPTAQAFIDMVKNADYQKAVRHRTAATADSRLIRCAGREKGTTFIPKDWDAQ